MSSEVSPDELEAGRKLFAGDWAFRAAAGTLERLPPIAGVEVAFAGRSNVGKSSLINALTGRNALARTSHTPGRTQELIFFGAGGPLTLVDMPGYGYAAVPRDKVRAWTDLIHAYLRGRANLARVYLLVDARHGLKEADTPVLDTLDQAAVSYAAVLTKADQVGASGLDSVVATLSAQLAKRAAAFPEIICTSSRTGSGIPLLRAAIAKVARERAPRQPEKAVHSGARHDLERAPARPVHPQGSR